MIKLSNRDAANIAAWRQGIPTTQAGVDALWTGIAKKLNATLPGTQESVGAGRTSPAGSSAAVDWSAIASAMNREAGLAAPAKR